MKQRSSFDRVKAHLLAKGSRTPAGDDLRDDLEMLVRRCDSVRSLGGEYNGVELSPYMSSLMRVSMTVPSSTMALKATVAASV